MSFFHQTTTSLISGWLLLTILFSGDLTAQAQPCTLSVAGRVLSADTGEPLSFATIAILNSGQGVIADADGHYRLDSLCAGDYVLVCSHIACHHTEHQLSVTADTQQNFYLREEAVILEGVTVRERALPPASMQAEERVSAAELGADRGLNLGEALSHLPGVSTLNIGATVSKPVVQGLHSNRVLLVNNGVRLEGQQWGVDHAPEIDPFATGEVRVVRGAAGVRYGVGALGGVILLEPPRLPDEAGIGGELNLAGYGNGRTGLAAGRLEGKFGKLPLAWRVQGSAKRGGNLRTPDYFLLNTGLEQYNYEWALGWRQEHFKLEAFYSRFLNRTAIFSGSHIGNLTDLRLAIERGRPLTDGSFTYELGRPQQRASHELFKVSSEWRSEKLGTFQAQLSRQFNRRREFDAHRNAGQLPSDFKTPQIEFEITTFLGDLVWEHRPFANLKGTLGVQGQWQRNTTDFGALLPDYRAGGWSAFWIERWRRYPAPLELEAGLRFDQQHTWIENRENKPIDQTLSFSSLSGTLGGIYHLDDEWQLRAQLGSAWRPPHLTELYSDGVHHGSAAYEQGNPNLTPERALQFSLGAEYEKPDRWDAHINLYYQHIYDFIFQEPQAEPVLTIRGAFPAFRFEQADARLMGLDGAVSWLGWRRLVWKEAFSLLRSRNLDRREPLFYMPADRFEHELTYHFGEREETATAPPYLQARLINVLKQKRVPEARDFAPPPAAYTRLDLEMGATLKLGKQPLTVSAGVYNVLNARYRDYLNRLRYFADEPGRNFYLQLRIPFGGMNTANHDH